MTLLVTGNLRLNWGDPAPVLLQDVRVIDRGRGDLAGGRARGTTRSWDGDEGEGISATFSVAGHLELDHSKVSGIGLDAEGYHETAIHVLAGGSTVVTDSVVFGGDHAIHNEGKLLVARSTLLNLWSGRLNTTGAGASILASTLVQRAVNTSLPTVGCAGTPRRRSGTTTSRRSSSAADCCTRPIRAASRGSSSPWTPTRSP